MFCMAFPCECPKPGKTPTAKKNFQLPVATAQEASTPAVADAVHAAMKGEAQALEERQQEVVARLQVEHDTAVADPEFVMAVKMLEPILHPDEKAKWPEILSPEPSQRALRWRERNA